MLNGDGQEYLAFVKSLAEGKIDFTHYGCHGQSIMSLPVYLITGSDLSVVYTSFILLFLSSVLLYKLGARLFNSPVVGVLLFVCLWELPGIWQDMLSGCTAAGIVFATSINMYLCMTKNKLAYLTLPLGLLFRPYLICLFPMLLYDMQNRNWWSLYKNILLYIGVQIVTAYCFISYQQTGKLFNVWALGHEGSFLSSVSISPENVLNNLHRLIVPSNYSGIQYKLSRIILTPVVFCMGFFYLLKQQERILISCVLFNFILYIITVNVYEQ